MQPHIWTELICSQIASDGFFSGVENTCALGPTLINRGVSRNSVVMIK